MKKLFEGFLEFLLCSDCTILAFEHFGKTSSFYRKFIMMTPFPRLSMNQNLSLILMPKLSMNWLLPILTKLFQWDDKYNKMLIPV